MRSMIFGALQAFRYQENDCLISRFSENKILRAGIGQKCALPFTKAFFFPASLKVIVNRVRAINGCENLLSCALKVQCIHRPEPKAKVRLGLGECLGWLHVEPVLRKRYGNRVEGCDIYADGNRRSQCSVSGVLKPFCVQRLLGLCNLLFGPLVCDLLTPHGERKSSNSQPCLSPGRPFALCDAEGASKPAAVVNRVGHVTSPVNCRAIVCGGTA